MKKKEQLSAITGGYSDAGNCDKNQDAFAVKIPSSFSEKKHKGIVASIADGVSCSENGQQASHTSVTQFIYDYYCTPDMWGVKESAQKVLKALNTWLFKHSTLRHNSFITTFSSVILKSTTAHIFHVGDSRVYRYRKGVLKQITHDHCRVIHLKNQVLTRALGMDSHLNIDYQTLKLQQDDLFLLSTDGVHDFVDDAILKENLALLSAPSNTSESLDSKQIESVAKDICLTAVAQKSKDNVSCLIIKICDLPLPEYQEVDASFHALTIPPALFAGNKIDSFVIEKVLYQGTRSHIYLAQDKTTKKQYTLKMPSLNFSEDQSYLQAFYRERWIGQKINNPYIQRIYKNKENSPYLYLVCEYIEGITLREWMHNNPHPSIDSVQILMAKIVKAVRVLQRAGVVHCDLKPENIMICENEKVMIIDFGAVQIKGISELSNKLPEVPLGAVDYIAPEYLNSGEATHLSDLFSLGVICYEMLCGQLPYIAAPSLSLKKARESLWQYREIELFRETLPNQLNAVLQKATHPALNKRYSSMSEFMNDFQTINQKGNKPTQFLTLLEASPLKFWKSVSFVLAVIVSIEFYFLIKS